MACDAFIFGFHSILIYLVIADDVIMMFYARVSNIIPPRPIYPKKTNTSEKVVCNYCGNNLNLWHVDFN